MPHKDPESSTMPAARRCQLQWRRPEMASERVICIDAKAKATFSKQNNALCKLVEMVLTLSRLHPSVTSREVRFARQKMALHVRVPPAAKAHASTVSFIARPDAFGLPDGRSAKGLSRHLRTRACRDIDAEKSTNPTLLVLVVLMLRSSMRFSFSGDSISAPPLDRVIDRYIRLRSTVVAYLIPCLCAYPFAALLPFAIGLLSRTRVPWSVELDERPGAIEGACSGSPYQHLQPLSTSICSIIAARTPSTIKPCSKFSRS